MRVEQFFDANAQARVAEAVRQAEAKSLGEVVPVVVEKSDTYLEARHRGALLGAGLITLALLAASSWYALELALFVSAQLAGAGLGYLVAAFDPIERFLIGRRAMTEAAQERAALAFQEHGLHRTTQGTGVLVFASLFEHAVVILGDRGIDEKMGPSGWQQAVDALVSKIKAGQPADGFCEAIKMVGDRLAEYFPKSTAPDANELSDKLRVPPVSS